MAGDQLPLAKTKPISLPQYKHQLYTYHMPLYISGQAKFRLWRIVSAVASSESSATLFQSLVTQAPDSSAPKKGRPILPKFVVPQLVLVPQLAISSANTSADSEPHVSISWV